mmetsp:Transcript_16515/g.34540  ORF Transcript_16515/g.34540 Transcript_16515/m.34540 type:complete len:619 (-) Transcript_16515:136-1992(-)
MASSTPFPPTISPPAKQSQCKVRQALRKSLHRRGASLTNAEKTFLSALLIDSPPTPQQEELHKKKIACATKVLNDEILFSVPVKTTARNGEMNSGLSNNAAEGEGHGESDENKDTDTLRPMPPKPSRDNLSQLDLWKAHQDGVAPAKLKEMSNIEPHQNDCLLSKSSRMNSATFKGDIGESGPSVKLAKKKSKCSSRRIKTDNIDGNDDVKNNLNKSHKTQSSKEYDEEDDEGADSLGAQSDQEVGYVNDDSSASSWNSSQGGFDHYNTWEVIKDEYAEDFGFKVAVENDDGVLTYCRDDDDEERGLFKILGTSSDDISAIPHVLSPPLMDSLLNFVPERLANNNFWLKFSLIRDGASLDILRRYCRAATHCVLAIETTNGEVFGTFTSAPWRINNKYFGTGESFLWRMRHNRNTPVHSLFEQAQLESEIDVFPYNGSNDYIQLCTRDKLALGGGSVLRPGSNKDPSYGQGGDISGTSDVYLEWNDYGFGLALDENLLHGTSSPCATFGNSGLVNSSNGGELFDVMNLEVWTFTSATTVRDAEQSELSTFFVRESMSSLSMRSGSANTSSSSVFSAEDLDRNRFYRRIGQEEDDINRNAWQYSDMMNPMAGSPYGKMK